MNNSICNFVFTNICRSIYEFYSKFRTPIVRFRAAELKIKTAEQFDFQIDWAEASVFGQFHSLSSLSYDRSKASSKASSLHSAIQSFLLQMRVSSPFLKVIQ
jgi:hypothetical protein